jgi:hypothetical protein
MIYNNVEMHNVVDVETDRSPGLILRRLPVDVLESANTCGCEIRFQLRGQSAVVKLRRPAVDGGQKVGVVDVFHGAFQDTWPYSPQFVTSEESEIHIQKPADLDLLIKISRERNLPFHPQVVRVCLPYDLPCRFVSVEGDVSLPTSAQVPLLRYLAYGSSITHGGNANSATESYAHGIARELKADLINLGFAGAARLEPEMADYIASRRDWNFATLELGINVLGAWPVAEFAERADYFIGRIAGSYPTRMVFCTDLFTCHGDFAGDSLVAEYREVIEETVERLDMPNVRYVPGHSLLKSATGLTVDLVHPSITGMQEIARSFAKFIRTALGDRLPPPK